MNNNENIITNKNNNDNAEENKKQEKPNQNSNSDNLENKKNNENNENKIKCNENSDNNDIYDYGILYGDKILGRFTVQEKINIINKLNIIVYGKIKKELLMELERKRFENKLLQIKSQYKTALILQKKLHSLVQEKMLRDFFFKKNLKDLRKKLMDEKIEKLKYKNLVFIMKAYGIYRGDKNYR